MEWGGYSGKFLEKRRKHLQLRPERSLQCPGQCEIDDLSSKRPGDLQNLN